MMVKAFGKAAGVLIAVAVLLFGVVVTFSAVESSFACSGTITKEPYQSSETIFIKLTKYRWWVGLWSDSSGRMHLEIPHEFVNYYEHIREAGDILQIFSAPNRLEGQFSTLSRSLDLKTPRGLFEGTCKPIVARD
jgi:hypothetical protein